MNEHDPQTALLENYLKALRLPAFLAHYGPVAEDAGRSQMSYGRYLLALCEQEVAQRAENRKRRLIKSARFPVAKELAEFDFSLVDALSKQQVLELAQGSYIEKKESILMVGNPGLGKTHIATGLGLAACRQGHKVRFYNAASLVAELMQAQEEHRLSKMIDRILRHRLIILDEVGFIPLTPQGAQLIFQLCSTLYERASMIVTTNLRFADWTQVFGDERLTAALLDRLTHRAHILEFIGESYRFRQRMKQKDVAVDSVDNAGR